MPDKVYTNWTLLLEKTMVFYANSVSTRLFVLAFHYVQMSISIWFFENNSSKDFKNCLAVINL